MADALYYFQTTSCPSAHFYSSHNGDLKGAANAFREIYRFESETPPGSFVDRFYKANDVILAGNLEDYKAAYRYIVTDKDDLLKVEAYESDYTQKPPKVNPNFKLLFFGTVKDFISLYPSEDKKESINLKPETIELFLNTQCKFTDEWKWRFLLADVLVESIRHLAEHNPLVLNALRGEDGSYCDEWYSLIINDLIAIDPSIVVNQEHNEAILEVGGILEQILDYVFKLN